MNLLKSLAAVSSMTMFSRVLGFARDAIVARVFGAGMATDAFFVAFKLPNLLRRIFAEGAFSQAFVPILAEYKSKQGEDATRVFVAYVSGLLTLALAIVTVLGMLAAPWVIMVTAPGFADTADKFALTTQLLRITFPYILLTPQGSRIARREYGSLLSALIDQPQNPALRLQVMSAVYVALSRWEPRLTLDSITISSNFDGSMVVELTGQRNNGAPVSLSVSTGADNGSD